MKPKERPAFFPMHGHHRRPDQFTPDERARFAELVKQGGEVKAAGLEERINQAAFLNFLYDRDMNLCGVAALKRPESSYRNGVFAKAETGFEAGAFGLELGWVVIAEKYRGYGLTEMLLQPLLKLVPDEPLYATTRIDNEPMRRSLLKQRFQSDGTHYPNEDGTKNLVLYLRTDKMKDWTGALKVRAQYHGTEKNFASFDLSELKSVGFHFGDIMQAKHFAKATGFIFQADLTFERCLDISSDWGWTSAQFVAFALYGLCTRTGIAVNREDFVAILGPGDWSTHSLKYTERITEDEQRQLITLFAKCGFDGVRYLNKFEPPGSVNRVAYFVIRAEQIKQRSRKGTAEYAISLPIEQRRCSCDSTLY